MAVFLFSVTVFILLLACLLKCNNTYNVYIASSNFVICVLAEESGLSNLIYTSSSNPSLRVWMSSEVVRVKSYLILFVIGTVIMINYSALMKKRINLAKKTRLETTD